ncbi:MAG: peptidoglycan-binding protein [Clostridia bacterium]|nr:peptidoglycan-binding protein [Clostridia bacterium]
MENKIYFSYRDNPKNIREIQTYLRFISRYIRDVPNVNPDGIYGPETEKAVSAFQKRFGLPSTGKVDFETWTNIVEVYDDLVLGRKTLRPVYVYPVGLPNFKEGDEFEEVYVLQVMLSRLAKIFGNIHPVKITGNFDSDTKKAVEDLERYYNRETKGMVDRELWNILADVYSGFTFND